MEVCDEFEVSKKSYKYKETLFGSLDLKCDVSKTMFVLWNKYQVFLHEGFDFANPTKILTPEFLIHQILVANSYLICVDLSGNVHTISLKFKNSAQKRLKSSFQPREEGVLQCTMFTSEYALSLKTEYNCYFLCQHKINAEFHLHKKIALLSNEHLPESPHNQGDCILHIYELPNENTGWLKSTFHDYVEKTRDCHIVLISFDKLTIYACLFNHRMTDDAVNLVKIYTSSSEICDFKIFNELSLIVGLSCGTIIHFPLKEQTKSPEITHLNTALSKFVITGKDTLIYTDGLSMWKADNIFLKEDTKFHEYCVKDVKYFIIHADQIICTTYSDFIYSFPVNEEHLKENNNGYSSAEKVLNNSECLQKVTQEIEKNKEIINKIECEGNYLTAVALSKRPDIMNKVIVEQVIVYESYEEIIKDVPEVILTENLEEYFRPNSLLFLINITTSIIQHSLSNILMELLKNVHIHITLISEETVLKTTSIKLNEALKKNQLLMPCTNKDLIQVQVEIKFVLNVPGPLDKKQGIWTVVHKNTICLNIEHFIKTNEVCNKVCYLKENQNNIEDLIIKTAEQHHGDLFEFTDTLKSNGCTDKSVDFFVKLPDNYKEVFKKKESYTVLNLSPKKVEFLEKKFTTTEFLNSKSGLMFRVGMKNVTVEILRDDFSTPVFKVTSQDLKVAFEMRNFLANFFYKDYNPAEEFVNNALYTTTENIQKALRDSRRQEDFTSLASKFRRNVIARFPL